ncbi:TetR/AcrR family transcriptional regulator [Kibdelosporangium lantanae]|uniref:TetR/AcrR family transcriptional regulator n=1 Tax=Kibdelosporangium lantanae TaxID=1497396 RepID=A0ABW3MC22_9PSEU
MIRSIKEAARGQLAEKGAADLSVRSVARELGVVSSALYRYFPSRDDLLTALIIDAYNAMGDAAEEAAETGETPRLKWLAACHAVRRWAKANPYEYALIYGSPIPGYVAPPDTVAAAIRVPLLLIKQVSVAREAGMVKADATGPLLTPGLMEQLCAVAEQVAPDLSLPLINKGLVVWTQLFGMLSFELFGQLVGSVDPADEFFAHTIGQMADFLGLVDPS